MATTEELVVRAKPEGLDETSRGFQQMEEDLDDAERQMEDTTGGLGDLAGKWKAALGAIVAGVAVAVGGLLSQVPIVGQVVGGLSSVVQGLAFQLDKKLRPVLQPLVSDLYELGNAVAAGDWDKAKNIFSDWASSLANFDWGGALNDIVTGFGDLVNNIGTRLGEMDLRQAVTDLRNGISTAVSRVQWGKAFNDIVGGLWNFLKGTDWLGIASDTIRWLANGISTWVKQTDWSKIYDNIVTAITSIDWVGIGTDIVTGVVDGIAAFTEWAIAGAADVGKWLYRESGLKDVVDGAFEWGKSLIQDFISGIQDVGGRISDVIMQYIPDPILDSLGFDVDSDNGTTGFNGFEVNPGGVSQNTPGIGSGTSGTRLPDTQIDLSVDSSVSMDGRNVTDQNGRYRADELSRLGRNG